MGRNVIAPGSISQGPLELPDFLLDGAVDLIAVASTFQTGIPQDLSRFLLDLARDAFCGALDFVPRA